MLADLLMPLPILAVILGFVALAGLAAQSLADMLYRQERHQASGASRMLSSGRL